MRIGALRAWTDVDVSRDSYVAKPGQTSRVGGSAGEEGRQRLRWWRLDAVLDGRLGFGDGSCGRCSTCVGPSCRCHPPERKRRRTAGRESRLQRRAAGARRERARQRRNPPGGGGRLRSEHREQAVRTSAGAGSDAGRGCALRLSPSVRMRAERAGRFELGPADSTSALIHAAALEAPTFVFVFLCQQPVTRFYSLRCSGAHPLRPAPAQPTACPSLAALVQLSLYSSSPRLSQPAPRSHLRIATHICTHYRPEHAASEPVQPCPQAVSPIPHSVHSSGIVAPGVRLRIPCIRGNVPIEGVLRGRCWCAARLLMFRSVQGSQGRRSTGRDKSHSSLRSRREVCCCVLAIMHSSAWESSVTQGANRGRRGDGGRELGGSTQ